ncbi:MAG TPA: winged helix-turn-helix domain-containing protein [Nitrosopumilaceae archaeon]|nr:winged helix-turn-helix domain-containing protein [Nitrosopumilaceae archaeon]
MQTLIQKRKVEEDDRKDAILGVLADKYCRDIIETTMEKSKSAMEISADTKIPISTVYRRLQTLYDNKLVGISGTISDDGKKFFMYKSKISSVCVCYADNQVRIEITPNTPSIEK